jgi:hypothetical protein
MLPRRCWFTGANDADSLSLLANVAYGVAVVSGVTGGVLMFTSTSATGFSGGWTW